jgi:hypothetical protein
MKTLITTALAGAAIAAAVGLASPAHADPCADNPNPPAWWQCPARTPGQQHQDDAKRTLCTYFRNQYPEDCVYY